MLRESAEVAVPRWMGGGRPLRRVVVALVTCLGACSGAFAQTRALVPATESAIALPPGSYLVTPYVEPESGAVVIHLQPRRGAGKEWLADARTGQPWAGPPDDVRTRFTRLPSETGRTVQAGDAWDQRLLRLIGCSADVGFCTSPADADLVVMMRLTDSRLWIQVADLRGVLVSMVAVMDGTSSAAQAVTDARQWGLLELLSEHRPHRLRWLDALRSVDNLERWLRVADAAGSTPRLLRWPAFNSVREGDGRVDLAGELERLGLGINVWLLARAASQRGSPEDIRALADALLLGDRIGFRGDVATSLVDVLLRLAAEDRAHIAVRLNDEARRRRSHGLWCYSEWLQAQSCAATPPWDLPSNRPPGHRASPSPPQPVQPPSAPSARAPMSPPVRDTQVPSNPPESKRELPAVARLAKHEAGDGPQEWTLIRRLPDRIQLLAYDERSGHMMPEAGAISGLSFVARALGPIQDGRFTVQVSPNAHAPVLLRHGIYRVRVRVVLDYTRVDSCVVTWACFFSSTERFARTDRRDLTFEIDPKNRFVDLRRADFGSLVPLVADGSQRYESKLTQAKLSIERILQFDVR